MGCWFALPRWKRGPPERAASVQFAHSPLMDIVKFFSSDGTDQKGRTIDDMIRYSDSQMEACHDHIQWMFPLHEKSLHALHSPVVTKEASEVLSKSEVAQEKMEAALKTFRSFLGIEPHDAKKLANWCYDGNHNLLRITRAIRSLRLFGMDADAIMLYQDVMKVAEKKVSKETTEYWDVALYGDLFGSMTDRFLRKKIIRV